MTPSCIEMTSPLLCLALLVPVASPAQSLPAPGLDVSRPLAAEQLRQLTLREIYLAKNEILARRGKAFTDIELHAHFSEQEWYCPTPAFSLSRMSRVERRNLDLLQGEERRRIAQRRRQLASEHHVDFGDIVNPTSFGEFTAADQARLERNGFVVFERDGDLPDDGEAASAEDASRPAVRLGEDDPGALPGEDQAPLFEQMHQVYLDNDERNLGSLVTSDAILHLVHLLVDRVVVEVESKDLYEQLLQLSTALLERALERHRGCTSPGECRALERSMAFVAVAVRLLHETGSPVDSAGLPDDAWAQVREEEERVLAAGSVERSQLLDRIVNYHLYVPRGHYTATERLQRFFKAMLWLSSNELDLGEDGDRELAVALSLLLQPEPGRRDQIAHLWRETYQVTGLIAGDANALLPADVQEAVAAACGNNASIARALDPACERALVEQASRRAQHVVHPLMHPAPEQARPLFSFMGQRYIPMAEIFFRLTTDPQEGSGLRLMPQGLDLFAALGSGEARRIMLEEQRDSWSGWSGYPQALASVVEDYRRRPAARWQRSLITRWLRALQALVNSADHPPRRAPFFATGRAWQHKTLNTGLASSAQLHRDLATLYGAGAGGLGGMDSSSFLFWVPGPPKGYVEPAVELYRRLQSLLAFVRQRVAVRGHLSPPTLASVTSLEALIARALRCSRRELRGEPLSARDYAWIAKVGLDMEQLWQLLRGAGESGAAEEDQEDTDEGDAHGWEESAGEGHMQTVAQLYFVVTEGSTLYLQGGVGLPHVIYAVAEIEGQLRLTRGAVFSYYEFVHDGLRPLADEEWRELYSSAERPPLQPWQRSYYAAAPGHAPGNIDTNMPDDEPPWSTDPGWRRMDAGQVTRVRRPPRGEELEELLGACGLE